MTTTTRPTTPRPETKAPTPLRKVRPAAPPEPEETDQMTDDVPQLRPAKLPWILALLGLIGTIGFGLAWANGRDGGSSSNGASAAVEASGILDAARSFTEDLTNFDGATIGEDFDRITARSTGEFRSQADQFFSSEVRKDLKAAQASSRGEIRSAYVQTADGERGSVFVVVDQTIANNTSPQPQADTLRMELGLIRKDGRWLVERVSVLTAPSGGATGAASTSGAPAGGETGGN